MKRYKSYLQNIVQPRDYAIISKQQHKKKAKYRIARFITGIIFKFLLPNYTNKRTGLLKNYLPSSNSKAKKPVALAFVRSKK